MTLNDYFYNVYVPTNANILKEGTLVNYCLFFKRYVQKNKLGLVHLENITVKDINEWAVDTLLTNSKLKQTTRIKYLKTLRSILQQAVDVEYMKTNPCDKAKRILARTTTESDPMRTFSVDEMNLIISNAHKYGAITELYVLLSFYTGARLSEVLHMRNSDINYKQGSIKIKGTKTSSSVRTVTVPFSVLDRIQEIRNKAYDNLFINKHTNKLFTPDNLRKRFYTLLKGLNLPHRRCHDIRHTYATYLITIARCDVYTVATFLGHTNPTMTLKRYTHLSKESKENVRKSLERVKGIEPSTFSLGS